MLTLAIIVMAVKYLGLLATVVLFLVSNIVSSAACTLDTSRWFFFDSLLGLLISITMACYGFYASRGGEPLFGRRSWTSSPGLAQSRRAVARISSHSAWASSGDAQSRLVAASSRPRNSSRAASANLLAAFSDGR